MINVIMHITSLRISATSSTSSTKGSDPLQSRFSICSKEGRKQSRKVLQSMLSTKKKDGSTQTKWLGRSVLPLTKGSVIMLWSGKGRSPERQSKCRECVIYFKERIYFSIKSSSSYALEVVCKGHRRVSLRLLLQCLIISLLLYHSIALISLLLL